MVKDDGSSLGKRTYSRMRRWLWFWQEVKRPSELRLNFDERHAGT